MTYKIKNINLALTNKCNLECSMCDIWKENPKIDLSLDFLNKILNNNVVDEDLDITLTGGEPFLHEKINDIVNKILNINPNALKTISTNGLLTDKIILFLDNFHKKLPNNFSLHISLDGINLHNKQRGKSLENIIKTIKYIKNKSPDINIKIKFTITPLNYSDLIPTYEFCKKNNLDFRIKLVEYAKNYTNKINKRDFIFNNESKKKITKDLLRIYKEKLNFDKKNAEFIKNTINKLLNKNEKIYCKAPFERIFVMPDGRVYSCIHFETIGNLNENSLDEIWNSEKAEQIRNKIKENKCNHCVAYHGLVI